MSAVHLLVRVGRERYALAVEQVLEVVRVGDVTPVPGAPPAVLGVRNLRGALIPVLDLAAVLELTAAGAPRAIVVVERAGAAVGLAVEELLEVEPLEAGATEEDGLVRGSAIADGALVGILDVARAVGAATGVRA